MWRSVLCLTIFAFLFFSCNNDDDVSVEDQAAIDDAAIEQLLMDHYFGDNGRVTRFDEDDDFDDDFPSLFSMATEDPSGFWYVNNPNVVAEGTQLTSNDTDSLLISYALIAFRGTEDIENPYGTLATFRSTINGSGLPEWDPSFYYREITEIEQEAGFTRELFEIEGIVEGLQNFRTTDTDGVELFNFQGVIVVPSRLAFNRDLNQQGVPPDTSFLLNFEAHRVLARASD